MPLQAIADEKPVLCARFYDEMYGEKFQLDHEPCIISTDLEVDNDAILRQAFKLAPKEATHVDIVTAIKSAKAGRPSKDITDQVMTILPEPVRIIRRGRPRKNKYA